MLKLFNHLKPFWTYIALVLVLVFFQSLSELYLPNLMANIVDTGIIKGDISYIFKVGILMLLVTLGGTICAVLASFLASKVAMGFGKILRLKVFTKVESFSFPEFNRFGTSSLITRTTNDITQMQQLLMVMLRMMVSAPMMCIGGIIMAVSKDAKLSLIIVVIVPVLMLSIYLISKKSVPLFQTMQVKLDKLNLVLRESLTGIRVIRAFNRVGYEKKRFQEANYDLTETALKVYKIMAALMPCMMLLLNLTTLVIIWFGGIRIDNGYMQVGDLMAFIQYLMQIMFSLLMFSMMFVMIPRASASAQRINEVLDTAPLIVDSDLVKDNSDHRERGQVEFRDVTFSYPGAEKPALKNISFRAMPGQTTAIIGGTGSGKSSLMSLLMRFYDVASGSILIDGVDIREISQPSLRAKIGYVPQKAILFTGTVADNIRYGKEDATESEVWQAVETAQAREFIDHMKDGINSYIAQGGTNISGGQKQRLSIARALVRRPKIYAFDDSLSALDFKTDAKLRLALKKETLEATVLIIAQRVSSVMDADQIVVLDEGEIVGLGQHKELLHSCHVYREIVYSQLSKEELA